MNILDQITDTPKTAAEIAAEAGIAPSTARKRLAEVRRQATVFRVTVTRTDKGMAYSRGPEKDTRQEPSNTRQGPSNTRQGPSNTRQELYEKVCQRALKHRGNMQGAQTRDDYQHRRRS